MPTLNSQRLASPGCLVCDVGVMLRVGSALAVRSSPAVLSAQRALACLGHRDAPAAKVSASGDDVS